MYDVGTNAAEMIAEHAAINTSQGPDRLQPPPARCTGS
jgi:hypothetical protein